MNKHKVYTGAELDEGTIHLWHVNLSNISIASLDILSKQEKQRAAGYRFARHRNAFIASRIATRSVLSNYLQCAAKDICFRYGQYGKPGIKSPPTPLTFNLSHSDGRMLIAIGTRFAVGVDLETLSKGRSFAEAINENLNPCEQAGVANVAEQLKDRLLLQYWTQKEAFVKALGVGLSLPPRDVDVRFEDAHRTSIRAMVHGERVLLQGRCLDCGPSHVGSLVGPVHAMLRHYRLGW